MAERYDHRVALRGARWDVLRLIAQQSFEAAAAAARIRVVLCGCTIRMGSTWRDCDPAEVAAAYGVVVEPGRLNGPDGPYAVRFEDVREFIEDRLGPEAARKIPEDLDFLRIVFKSAALALDDRAVVTRHKMLGYDVTPDAPGVVAAARAMCMVDVVDAEVLRHSFDDDSDDEA